MKKNKKKKRINDHNKRVGKTIKENWIKIYGLYWTERAYVRNFSFFLICFVYMHMLRIFIVLTKCSVMKIKKKVPKRIWFYISVACRQAE